MLDLEIREIKFSKKNLRSIIINLLSNAVKYKSNDRLSKIHIKSQMKKEGWELSIQDNGLRHKRRETNQNFSKFKRVHDLDTNIEGSGIGLYLVKKMILMQVVR